MNISTTTEDLLATSGNRIIIVPVNSLGYGSIGIMARIRKELPIMFSEYHELCRSFNTFKLQFELLGTFRAVRFQNSNSILVFAFAQKFYSDTKYENDLDAWEQILTKIKVQMQKRYRDYGEKGTIHMSDKIGINMSPSDVVATKEVIEKVLAGTDIDIVYHESRSRYFQP